MLGERWSGESLARLLDPASAAKCERFLQRAFARGAFGWELHVRAQGEALALLFGGVSVAEARLLVVATDTHEGLLRLLDERCAEVASAGALKGALPRAQRVLEPFWPLGELLRINSDLLGLQRMLAKRNAELVAITKQRNELLAVAAHDLRNPLLIVQGYCDLLSLGGGLAPAAQRELVERIQRAAALMLHVLEDTLEYSRLENEQLQPQLCDLDLSALARESVEGYRALAERKQIQLLFSCCEELPRLQLDATNMEQIVGNLLSNAIKYSDSGGQVELTLQQRGAHVVLSVADHGQGISEAELPLLFRPFQTTSARPTAGELSTGLGLAIVHKLVEANGGEVSVSSILHRGSTFSVKLPVPGASERPRARSAGACGVNAPSRFTRVQS